jgi:Transglutaminase-like superfamily
VHAAWRMLPLQGASAIARKLARLRALEAEERWALLHAWVLLAGLQVGLTILPFKRRMRLLRADDPRVPATGPHPERLAFLVEVAARYQWPAPSCLVKSLAVYALLVRRGWDAGLVIGASRKDGRFDAHAWPEHMGRPLTEGSARPGYEPLIRWPRGKSR